MQPKIREALPHVAAVLDHPRVQENPHFVEALELCADDDTFRRLSYSKLAIILGIHLGMIKQLLDENDALRTSLMALESRSVQ